MTNAYNIQAFYKLRLVHILRSVGECKGFAFLKRSMTC